jgi:hypothetical protein
MPWVLGIVLSTKVLKFKGLLRHTPPCYGKKWTLARGVSTKASDSKGRTGMVCNSPKVFFASVAAFTMTARRVRMRKPGIKKKWD